MSTVKPSGKDLLHLVGNPGVYAVQKEDGSWYPVRARLTPKVIRQHREGELTVGTYIVSPPDQARTLVFDIDAKSDDEQEKMLSAVIDVLREVDLPFSVEFSGRKGYHVWVVAEEYMLAEDLYRLGRGIRDEAGYPAMEVFPKQTHVRDLGNLVKLPGGKHRVTGKANDWITHGHAFTEDKLVPLEELARVAALYPEVAVRRTGEGPQSIEYPCVFNIQSGVKEGGRNIHLFHLATMLRRWSVNDENVETILRNANAQSEPEPVPEEELLDILNNSRYSGPVCGQIDGEYHCGDQCILARHQGLYTRAGALKWAQPGEAVVVEVDSRTDEGRTVELNHPDLAQGRGILKDAPPKRKKQEAE